MRIYIYTYIIYNIYIHTISYIHDMYIYICDMHIYIYIHINMMYIHTYEGCGFRVLRENEGVPQEGLAHNLLPDLCPGESAQTISKKRCTETSPESFNQKQQTKQQTCICTKKLFQHVLTCTIPKRYSSSLQQDISLNSNSSQSWTPSMKVLGGLGCANM